ncbi:MAG: winged helix DNA-binding protein, partial [Tistlia sp.]|uniref:MarR family winged helix-turn-helix transcriptional regulator n=1 Tax=Tistlia sp. TaxID=3057121 RepID=UPI0034A1D9E4
MIGADFPAGCGESAAKRLYLQAITGLQQLHRQLLELVKVELGNLGVNDVNNVQALLLYNIGGDEISVGELNYRANYLDANITHKLKKLVEAGYVEQRRAAHDRRSVQVRLTPKGLAFYRALDAAFDRQARALERQ